jgi:DNA-binding transcriptional LysR family regulator
MPMDNWDEIRTAYQVARMGTVSGAADVLGVHHATVIRHIDALEKRLGSKLFQRHARGYTATEAGRDLLSVAQATNEQFSQLASRIKGRGESVSGELVVTSITGIAPLMVPIFASFQREHPSVVIRYLTDMRLFRLDYGEAHVAIRAGGAPQEADNVVQLLTTFRVGLYASKAYIAHYGMPKSEADFASHRFIAMDGRQSRAPFFRWLQDRVPPDCFTFKVTETAASVEAICAGIAIGFMNLSDAADHEDLVQVMPPDPEWDSPLWIVTHVDLHRTLKVQSFLTHLKAAAAAWPQ